MDQDSYAKLFWANMQEYNNTRIELQVEEKIIALLESHVTCKSWYACENCKGFKKAIAVIKNKENEDVERHTNSGE